MADRTQMAKAAINLIQRGERTLSIVEELKNRFGLLSCEETSARDQINALRDEIAAYKPKAVQLAKQLFEDGFSWKEVVTELEKPGLLSSGEVIGIACMARDSVKAAGADEAHAEEI